MTERVIELNDICCHECGIRFGIDKRLIDLWINSHKDFVCPNGHHMHYNGKPKLEKENEQLSAEVKTLKEQLKNALKELELEKSKISELIAELELWKPEEK